MVTVILDSIGKNEEFESLAILLFVRKLILSLTTAGRLMVLKLTVLTIHRPPESLELESSRKK